MRRLVFAACFAFLSLWVSPGFGAVFNLETGIGIICHKGKDGFLIRLPTDWIADEAAGREMDVCVVCWQDGFDFHSAPVIMYPRVILTDLQGQAAINSLVEESRRTFGARPGGEQMRLEAAGTAPSGFGGNFQLYRLSNGPSPNKEELLAYAPSAHGVLLLVFSAYNASALEEARPALLEMLKSIEEVKIE